VTATTAVLWALAAASAGLLMPAVAVGVPTWRDATATSVAAGRRAIGRPELPGVLRWGLDGVLLAAAGLVFWATSRSHYNLVLAPEGVPTVSVNYWELAGPLLLWIGAGLLSFRLVDLFLHRGGRVLRGVLRPLAGSLRGPTASTLRRRRRALATGVVLVALSAMFAISTAVFNTTYRHQVQVDALLTNGAPVSVIEAPGSPATGAEAARLAGVPG